MKKKQTRRWPTAAAQFETEAWARAHRLPRTVTSLPGFQGWFRTELEAFDDQIERGRYKGIVKPGDREALHQEFAKLLIARLAREPAVEAVYKRRASKKVSRKSICRQAEDRAVERVTAALETRTLEEIARVRRDEASFHQLAGARAAIEALQRAGALTPLADDLLTCWNGMRGFRILSIGNVQILPPVIPE